MSLKLTLAAPGFQTLTVADRGLTVTDPGDHLRISFGPLPLLGSRIRYPGITRTEPTRSCLIVGWGIHWIPFRGWTFNLWGCECVRFGNRAMHHPGENG